MKKVEYKAELFQTLSEVAKIIPTLCIKKEATQVVLRAKDVGETKLIEVKAPLEYLKFEDFQDDTMNFWSFTEFYNLFGMFENPIIKSDGQDLHVKTETSKFKYRLASGDMTMMYTFEEDDYDNPDFDCNTNLTVDDMKSLNSIASGISSDELVFTTNSKENKIDLLFQSSVHDNTFNHDVSAEYSFTEGAEDYSITISSDDLKKLPIKEYSVELSYDGVIKFSYISDENIVTTISLSDIAE